MRERRWDAAGFRVYRMALSIILLLRGRGGIYGTGSSFKAVIAVVVGVILGAIDLHFVWQVWPLMVLR